MIFGAKPLYSANTNIDALFENGEASDLTGAIALNQKEGRKTVKSGKIYFRKGLVYAAEVDSMPIPIGKRVATGGLVDYDELNDVCGFAGGYNNQKVVDILLERQLISEKQINIYIKEHFLALMEEILSWENCEGQWVPETSTRNFIMPYVPIQKIRSILTNRQKFRNGFKKSVQGFFTKEEIAQLTFVSVSREITGLNNEFNAILGYANGEYTVAHIAEETGLTEFNTLQALVSLWKDGFIHIQLGGIKLPFASLIKHVNSEKDKPVEEPYKEEIVPLNEEQSGQDETPVEEEENRDEEIILDTSEKNTPAEYTLPNSTASEETHPEGMEDDHILIDAPNESKAPTPIELSDESDYEIILAEEATGEVENIIPVTEDVTEETETPNPVTEEVEVSVEPETLPNNEELPAREVEEPETVEAETFVSDELPVEKPTTPVAPTPKDTMNTPNKVARSSKLHEFTKRITELQSGVADLEAQLDVSEQEYSGIQTEVERLEEALRVARGLAEESKAKRDKIASEYENSCNEVAQLIASFQIAG